MNATLTYSLLARLLEGSSVIDAGIEDLEEMELPGITEKGNPTVKVAAGASDAEHEIGLVNPLQFLLIVTDQDISVKFSDAANDAHSIKARGSGTDKAGILFWTSENISSLFFSNAGENPATVRMFYGA